MLGKKAPTARIDEAVAKSINFEVTMADLARRSERRAWWVAAAAVLMALVLAAGYFYMLPLKQKVPYLVMADAYTGTSTVARLTTGPGYQRITSSDAINRSNVAHYVLARESYDLTLLNLRDWNSVMTMSSPNVATAYRALYSSLNENNPYKVYGRGRSVRVKILSIVLIGGGGARPPTGATVRFQRSIYLKQSGALQPLDNKIATLAFTYNPDLKMADRYRVDNPLGFLVTDYRVDNDYDSTPPMAIETRMAGANGLSVTPVGATQGGAAAGSAPAPGDSSAPLSTGNDMQAQTAPGAPIATTPQQAKRTGHP
jgi:type IV secretion system protein VirB8